VRHCAARAAPPRLAAAAARDWRSRARDPAPLLSLCSLPSSFDPLALKKSSSYEKYRINEIKNGRLAMLAFSGICTQAALTGKSFPYF
jgi:hypothetical protein